MHNEKNNNHHEIPFKGEFISPRLIAVMLRVGNLALEVQKKGLKANIKSTKEDIVTEGDTMVTQELKKSISALYPGSVFMDEETPETHTKDIKDTDVIVIIDPIDGTGNYYNASLEPDESKRNPNWGISVGFVKNGEIIAGIIAQPQTGDIYYAEKGKGAYKNGRRLQVSATNNARDAKLIYSPPYPKDKEAYEANSLAISRIESDIPIQISRLNSQVIETMQVAEGRQDVFIHLKTKPWDITAAIAIVTEAGGRSLDAEGKDYKLFGETILLTNSTLNITPITKIISSEVQRIK